MVIPIGDANPTRRRPWVTRLLLLGNIGVFLLLQPWAAHPCEQHAFFLAHAAVPAEILQGEPLTSSQVAAHPLAGGCDLRPTADKPVYQAVVQSMFLHAGWLHLLGNMLYLWIFGNNIEDRLGHVGFVVFYVVCGLVATAAFVAQNPHASTPLVGASGAIAGVLGAYIVMFPRQRITVVAPIFLFAVLQLPAAIVLGMWFVLQLRDLTPGAAAGGGVAYLAHVTGFVAGCLIVLLLGHRPEPRRPRRGHTAGWS